MTSDRLQRTAATAAVAAGTGLLALAAGGIASLDATLRAAAPAREVTTRMVVDVKPAPGGCGRERPAEFDRGDL